MNLKFNGILIFLLIQVSLSAQIEQVDINGGIIADSINIRNIPAFRAELTANIDMTITPNDTLQIAALWVDNPISSHQSVFDNGDNFNSNTGIFIAPRSGIYFFQMEWHFVTDQAYDDIFHSFISVNQSTDDNCIKGFATLVSTGNTFAYPEIIARLTRSFGGVLKLEKGDTISIQLAYLDMVGSNNIEIESHSAFSGYLLSDID